MASQGVVDIVESIVSRLNLGSSYDKLRSDLKDRHGDNLAAVVLLAVEYVASNLLLGATVDQVTELLQSSGADARLSRMIVDLVNREDRGHPFWNNIRKIPSHFQEDPHIAQARLLVIGDSHSLFWSGEDVRGVKTRDHLPGIITKNVGSIPAWNLIKAGASARGREKTIAHILSPLRLGFRGWIMLSFGEVDIRCHILKSAPRIGLTHAVSECVNRYIAFIREVQQLHDKVAVWGPIASGDINYNPQYPFVGNQLERNYTTILFTEMLQSRCGVPVLSALYSTMLDNGYTNGAILYDGTHLSQKMLPYAMDIAHQKLGLNCAEFRRAPGFMHRDITDQAICESLEVEGRLWTQYDMQCVTHVDTITINGPALYDTDNPLWVVLTNDFQHQTRVPCTETLHIDADSTRSFPVDQSARYLRITRDCQSRPSSVVIHATVSFINLEEIKKGISPVVMRSMAQASLVNEDGTPPSNAAP